MAQPNKLFLFITGLLLNGAIISCDSCKSEKDKLVAQEKGLIEKLKKQVQPSLFEVLEKGIQETKNNPEGFKKDIKETKEFLQTINEIEKENYNQVHKEDVILFTGMVATVKGTNVDQKELKRAGKRLKDKSIKVILQDPVILKVLKDKNNITKLRQYFSDLLALFETIQKQAELKK